MSTYRVKTRAVSFLTYEIEAANEGEARELYVFGDVVRDEFYYDDIESVVEIDTAQPTSEAHA